MKYSVPIKVPIVFYNGCNYDYNFIIKDLAKEFEQKFNGLGENIEKYITFSITIEKEVIRIDKSGEGITKAIFFKLQFIDSARFLQGHYQIIFIILLEKFRELNVNIGLIIKNMIKIKYKHYEFLLDYTKFKDNLIK